MTEYFAVITLDGQEIEVQIKESSSGNATLEVETNDFDDVEINSFEIGRPDDRG